MYFSDLFAHPYNKIRNDKLKTLMISLTLGFISTSSVLAQPNNQTNNVTEPQKPPEYAAKAVPSSSLSQSSSLLVDYGPLTFAPLVKKVVPAVVNIAVSHDDDPATKPRLRVPPSLKGTPFEKEFRQRQHTQRRQTTEAGSGFIIDPKGVIVTNTHVVGDADNIMVSMIDGTQFSAEIVGTDYLTDIAVIQVNSPKPLPYVKWGDSRKVEVGDWVLAAGNPFGLGSSVTAGIVSARGRDIGASPFDDFLQLDAPMNPGNSGGPSFNLSGQVVALNTAIVSPTGSSVGIGFGIPSEIVAPIVEQLCKTGYIDRGWLGVTLEDNNGHDGVKITGIDRKGPAEKAKIKIGDRVELIDSQHVDTVRTFMKTVAIAHPGSTIELKIKRGTKNISLPVIVGHRPLEADN